MYDNTSRVLEVNIDEILPNRFQPRIQFDEEEILELSDSIKEHGVIQPIVVRTIGDKYEIIAGERRYKASVLAGKETVPVIVKNLNDKDSAEIALIENVQRKNLTPIEEALSYKKILDMDYITQENLASKLGKSQSSIANKIRLLNLSDEVQEALLENKISERHARSLLKLKTSKQQNEMLDRIITERLTVRRTDEEIQKLLESSDDSNDDSQKIIEKGEKDMNNNNFGMPSAPQPGFNIFGTEPQNQPQPSFDIFGNSQPTANNVEMSSMNTVESSMTTFEQPKVEQPQTEQTPSFNFDMPSMPQTPVQPVDVPPLNNIQNSVEMPSMNTVESSMTTFEQPVVEQPQMEQTPSFNFDIPSMPQAPEQPVDVPPLNNIQNSVEMSSMSNVQPSMTTFEQPIVEQPQIEPMSSFDFKMPEQPVEEQVPSTTPIIDNSVSQPGVTQQSESFFSFGEATKEAEPAMESEFKMPEPIIVTDYSKQYDPVMPTTIEQQTPKVEFKEVINAIRECSNKIEQYGFKIDVEEYDLANLYQVIFKIEK